MSTGLFFVRRESTCITRSISRSRPTSGSSFLSRASWVRLRPNWSSTAEPARGLLLATAGGRADGLLALVARHHLDDLLAHATEVRAERDEHLRGDAVALADEAEQHVLGADVGVAELERLAQRELEDLLRPRGERRRARRGRARHADRLFDLLADGLERDAERVEGLGGDALALVDQAEQDVLSADEAVVELACLFLGKDEHPSCSVGKSLKQRSASRHWTVCRVYRCDPPIRRRIGWAAPRRPT